MSNVQPSAVTNGRTLSATDRYDASAEAAAAIALIAAMVIVICVVLTDSIVASQPDGIPIRRPWFQPEDRQQRRQTDSAQRPP